MLQKEYRICAQTRSRKAGPRDRTPLIWTRTIPIDTKYLIGKSGTGFVLWMQIMEVKDLIWRQLILLKFDLQLPYPTSYQILPCLISLRSKIHAYVSVQILSFSHWIDRRTIMWAGLFVTATCLGVNAQCSDPFSRSISPLLNPNHTRSIGLKSLYSCVRMNLVSKLAFGDVTQNAG
jgi:hypothetical protein